MDTLSEGWQELLTRLALFAPKLVVSLVVFVLTLIVAGLLNRVVRRTLKQRDVSAELTLLISKATRWSIIILGTMVALQQVEFDVTAFLTGLGILGFTIGFAVQDVSKNFVSGVLLLLQQPFNIGDSVKIGDLSGTVTTVELRATELRTYDGRKVVIPNAHVFDSAIVNYGPPAQRLVTLTAGVSYECDLEFVRQTAMNAIAAIRGVCQDPAPRVAFDNLGSATVDFTLYYWIDKAQIGVLEARDAGIIAIKTSFEAAEIEMPFPTQVVYVRQ